MFIKLKVKGFTLVEIMIAVAILSVLAAVGITQYTSYIKKSRVVNAISYVQAMKDKVMLYYLDNQNPPQDVIGQEISKTLLDNTVGKSISNIQYFSDTSNLPAGISVPQGNDVKFIISAQLNSNLAQGNSSSHPMLYMVVTQAASGEFSVNCNIQGAQGTATCNSSCINGPTVGGVCQPCTGNTYFDGNSCVSCTGTGGTCSNGTVSCSSGQYLQGSTCTNCEGTMTAGVCVTCSNPTPYWNSSICAACPTSSCINNIPDCSSYGVNYYWNTASNSVQLCRGTLSVSGSGVQQCITCSGSTPYYNSNGTCAACPQGLTCPGNGTASCPTSGQYYNGSSCVPCLGTLNSGLCTPCANGTYWNSNTQICTSCPAGATCSAGEINAGAGSYYNGQSITQCAAGSTPAANGQGCVTAIANAVWNSNNYIACNNGGYFTGSNCTNTPCGSGSQVNTSPNGTGCVTTIPGAQWNSTTNTVTCSASSSYFSVTGQNFSNCPTGFTLDPTGQTCDPPKVVILHLLLVAQEQVDLMDQVEILLVLDLINIGMEECRLVLAVGAPVLTVKVVLLPHLALDVLLTLPQVLLLDYLVVSIGMILLILYKLVLVGGIPALMVKVVRFLQTVLVVLLILQQAILQDYLVVNIGMILLIPSRLALAVGAPVLMVKVVRLLQAVLVVLLILQQAILQDYLVVNIGMILLIPSRLVLAVGV